MYESRGAKEEDFEMIARFPQDRKEAFYMYPRGSYPFSPDQLYEVSLTRAIPTVILKDDEIVGYANVYDWAEGESCWLGNVIINPIFRGKGAGKHLIEVLKNRAKEELNVEEVNLVCHNINTNALLFYNKLGFKPYDFKTILDYENNEIAGIVMKVKV
jgi:ribosomal protein S18 acetylase RimI-like enzyme